MPILTEEVSLYPESLLEACCEGAVEPAGDRATCPRWWVVQTKSQQEKAVARALHGRNIAFYLPLVSRTGVYHRHRVTAFKPLFAGYVFVFGSDEGRAAALGTRRVSRILDVHAPERLVMDLRRVRRLIRCGAPLTVESRLVAGNRVRVKHGPLAGLEGTVLTRRGRTWLLVQVDFLQKGCSVEIDDFLLEPIG